jgi:hypothetical protein
MTTLVLRHLILESLTPSVNAPLKVCIFHSISQPLLPHCLVFCLVFGKAREWGHGPKVIMN